MKTLIFNGSPRKNGDTAYLISVLTENLIGEYTVVDCYSDDISPCIDCRACRERSGCAISDGMQRIYDLIGDCDNVVIASPIYFSQPTGRLLDVWSRFQTFFSARYFRHEDIGLRHKMGAMILVGGGSGGLQTACDTAKLMLRSVNVREILPAVSSCNTDDFSAHDDSKAAEMVRQTALLLNNGR